MSIYDIVARRDEFQDTLSKLTRERFLQDIGLDNSVEIEKEKVQKSAWIASILAESDHGPYRELALSYAILSYLRNQGSEDEAVFREYAKLITSRLRSFPALSAFEEGDEIVDEAGQVGLGPALMSEIQVNRESYRIESDDVLTDFQYDVWEALNQSSRIAVSAPTSAGKSFVLREYLKHLADSENSLRAIYIVPTRALISEVSSDFRRSMGGNIEIRTSGYAEEIESDEFLLVLTPERCLHFLEQTKTGTDLDVVFLDELQRFENSGRGPLFEFVIRKLADSWPEAQMISAGPFIKNAGEVFEHVLPAEDGEVEEVQTLYTPVVHIESKFTLDQESGRVGLEYHSSGFENNGRNSHSIEFSVPEEKRKQISKIADRFTDQRQSMVYVPSPNKAESVAKVISDSRSERLDSIQVDDLADYVEETIHSEYPLVEPLKYGVAFHHGGVPQIIRNEVERLYRNETIDTIICTPTLLEGVNLPAEKLFIAEPKKGGKELSTFEIQNLVGRVGRVGTKPYGSVHYVETSENRWADDYMGKIPEKEVIPATSRVLSDQLEEVTEYVSREDLRTLEDEGVKNTIIFLRSKYIQDPGAVRESLRRKQVPEQEIEGIVSKISDQTEDLRINPAVINRNPTIDPLLQEKLFHRVISSPHSFYVRESNLQSDLFDVLGELNQIFEFGYDRYNRIFPEGETELTHSMQATTYTAIEWLSGYTYQDIIRERQQNVDESITSSINKVMDMVSEVRYVYVKYVKLLGDIFEMHSRLSPTPLLPKLDKCLERGTLDPRVLELIDLGVDRNIAISIATQNIEELTDLEETEYPFSELHNRYLRTQGFIDGDN